MDRGQGWETQEDLEKLAKQFRRFNRLWMSKMRPLRDAMRGPAMHASYLRVLREIGESPEGTTPSTIAGRLNMHPSLVCRILNWFRALGYLEESPDPDDGRRKVIELSKRGRADFERLQERATHTATFMLELLLPKERARFIAAMVTIESVLRYARWDDIRPPPL